MDAAWDEIVLEDTVVALMLCGVDGGESEETEGVLTRPW
jgi:hypothetical protein